MKKILTMTAAALLLMSLNLQAQPPQGGRSGGRPQGRPEGRPGREEFKMPEVLADTVYAETKTAEMAEKYELTDEQFAAVYALNLEYASKLQFDPSLMGEMNPGGERKDPRQMSDAERQEFFNQMQERMMKVQDAWAEIEDSQKAFDLAMKEILTKDQYKLYKKDRRKEENERQRRMQGPRGGMGGPGGGPGGGFGGPGGGFGGPGGGFGGDF